MGNSLQEPNLPQIESAIDEVVSALVAYRREPPAECARARAGRETMESGGSIQDLLATDRAILKSRDLVYSPVEIGLKHALKELGKLVHASAGDDRMIEVAERVCELDPDNWGRRMSPIDSAWDGIGSWHA